MIKHLIFDVDGTIWDSTVIVAKGWNLAIEETGYTDTVITAQMLQKEFGKTMDVIADDLFGDAPDREKRQELLERCCYYEHRLLEQNETDISYPGMYATMEKLAADYDLYIVSNCQKGYIELVMEKNHMAHLIRDHECFGNTGVTKGETIRILMERCGIRQEEAVYIGDTVGDKEASEAAGIPFLYAAYGFGDVKDAKLRIDSFGELPTVLEALNGAGRSAMRSNS